MLKELDRRILTLCAESHIGLSSMIGHIAGASRDGTPAELQSKTLAVVDQLLKEGLIRAGRPTPDGKAFVAWDLAAKESMERIKREWDTLGRAPAPGDITWFAATKEGVRAAGKT